MKEWIAADNVRIKTEASDYSAWWKVFNDPVLDSLIESAYRQNLTLQIAGLRIIQARAQLGIATGSQYPQLQTVSGTVTANRLSENSPNFNSLIDKTFTDYRVGFDAAWELDFWGRFRRNVEAAEAGLTASIADYDDALVSLTAEVAGTYITIRTQQERLRLAQNNIKLQERSLQIADVRFRNGATTELDVQQAKSNLANTQALVPILVRSVRQGKNALSVLLGMPPGHIDEVLAGSGEIPKVPAEVVVGIPTDLLRRRPDIRSAELQAAMQSALIGVAQADLYPGFFLAGSIGWNTSNTGNSSPGDLFDANSLFGFIGPGFSWNIFNYGRIRNNVRAQDAVFQQTLVNYRDTVLTAYRETEDAMIAFVQSQDEAKYRAEAATAAARSTELANTQYRDGAVDFQRVVDSERFLVQQQDLYTATRGDIALNLVALYKALGGGWQIREGEDYVSKENTEAMRQRTNWGRLLPPSEPLPDELAPPAPASDQPFFPKPEW
jgi:NodT family efflux transporter outer membrane factor (OMF) lipoprotein